MRVHCPVPMREMQYINPLDGVATMLELGNKSNARGTYKRYFESLGVKHTSVDWNGEDGALKLDLRKPLALGAFDMVTNIGTTPHIDGQLGAWRNIYDAADKWLVCVTPVPGEWPGAGPFCPSHAWYIEWLSANGFTLRALSVHGHPGKLCHYVRAERTARPGFKFIEKGLVRPSV